MPIEIVVPSGITEETPLSIVGERIVIERVGNGYNLVVDGKDRYIFVPGTEYQIVVIPM